MCGIVGLYAKSPRIEEILGSLLADMLITMTDRGPDSAGFAIYRDAIDAAQVRITVQSKTPEAVEGALAEALATAGLAATLRRQDTHLVVSGAANDAEALRSAIAAVDSARIMSVGEAIEIYKETGLPKDVVQRFGLREARGTHGIGHTRMATESAVTTLGAHPFSTGSDQCLVHNGSLSNHNNIRRDLVRSGVRFETENDSEVAAAYLSRRMAEGRHLGDALSDAIDDLDGFYTFVVGTRSGFGVLRDPIACKPAVMAETEDYVAFGSEYRALAGLPGIETARVWEPEPATVYFWERPA